MDTEKLTALFRKNRLKLTAQRLAIFKLIISRKDHPTTEQIYEELKNDYPTISMGTVYKTLHLLKQLGLIQELGFKEGFIRYDPNMELHINMVCTSCGTIHDFKSETFNSHWEELISKLGFKPKGQRIDLYYECEKCRK